MEAGWPGDDNIRPSEPYGKKTENGRTDPGERAQPHQPRPAFGRPVIELVHGDWRLDVAPHLGASIARLTWRGRDVLRPMPVGSSDVLEASCFPLVPYANRIADGRFTFGREVQLAVLPTFAPHALHGDGWLKPWEDLGRSDGTIGLIYRHAADAWPWAYEAIQSFALTDEGLRVDLSLTNTGDEAMPAGLGLHPYFPVSDRTRLSLEAPAVWALAEGQIPTALFPAKAVFDWAAGPRVIDAPFVDHCYVGWGGTARLTNGEWVTTVTASDNAAWAHVFAPGQDFCCIEPVTHRPDALHAPDGEASGLVVLQPGETLSMTMGIAVSQA